MPRFEVQGKHYESGKQQTRTYDADNEFHAVKCGLADGLIVEKTTLVKDEPPTEKQLSYAKDLGILVEKDATKNEVRDIISAKLTKDKPSSSRHQDFAKYYGVEYTGFTGKRDLFDRIFTALNKPEKNKDLVAWFTYRVYRDLVHGRDDGPIDHPRDTVIQKIADDLSKFDSVIKSIKKYKGRDIVSFGSWTAPDGYEYNGGSNRTTAYKLAASALRQHLDLSKYSTRDRIDRKRDIGSVVVDKSGRGKQYSMSDKKLGYAAIIAAFIALTIIFKACRL